MHESGEAHTGSGEGATCTAKHAARFLQGTRELA